MYPTTELLNQRIVTSLPEISVLFIHCSEVLAACNYSYWKKLPLYQVLQLIFFFFLHSIVLCPLCADAQQYVLCLGNQLAKKTPNNQPNVSHRAQSILRFFAAQMCE